MRKRKYIILLLVIFIQILLFANQKKIEEKVEVLNVEVPVRVVFKGKLIGGLKKSDFRIYENGKLQNIHGFNEYRRKIKVKETGLDVKLEKILYKPRFFVLVFNLTDYFLKMDKGIDFLFDKVLHKNDRIMVLANHVFIPEKSITNLPSDKNILKSTIKNECKSARLQVLKVFRDMDTQINLLKNELAYGFIDRHPLQAIASFLEKYLNYFNLYKRTYLIPDIDKFYTFARYLENVKMEKWVINFYQLERFPKLRKESRIWKRIEQELAWGRDGKRRVRDLLKRIDRELLVSDDFPVDQITKLFMKVNTTFHSIFMKPINIDPSEDYEYKEINTDIENSLSEITKMTGGKLILSNKLEKALEKISEKEDIFYMLTYEPKDRDVKKRKIKVKVQGKRYKVLYDKTVYADFFQEYLERKEKEIQKIKINNFKYFNRSFSFDVLNYKIEEIKNENLGKVKIRINIHDENNESVFDREKILFLKRIDNRISIRLDELKRGKYVICIFLTDLLSKKSCDKKAEIFIE